MAGSGESKDFSSTKKCIIAFLFTAVVHKPRMRQNYSIVIFRRIMSLFKFEEHFHNGIVGVNLIRSDVRSISFAMLLHKGQEIWLQAHFYYGWYNALGVTFAQK